MASTPSTWAEQGSPTRASRAPSPGESPHVVNTSLGTTTTPRAIATMSPSVDGRWRLRSQCSRSFDRAGEALPGLWRDEARQRLQSVTDSQFRAACDGYCRACEAWHKRMTRLYGLLFVRRTSASGAAHPGRPLQASAARTTGAAMARRPQRVDHDQRLQGRAARPANVPDSCQQRAGSRWSDRGDAERLRAAADYLRCLAIAPVRGGRARPGHGPHAPDHRLWRGQVWEIKYARLRHGHRVRSRVTCPRARRAREWGYSTEYPHSPFDTNGERSIMRVGVRA